VSDFSSGKLSHVLQEKIVGSRTLKVSTDICHDLDGIIRVLRALQYREVKRVHVVEANLGKI